MMMKKSKLCSAVQAPSNVTGRMYRIIRGNIPAVFFSPFTFRLYIPPDRYTCFPLISISEREKYYKIDRNLISDPVRPKVVTPISSKIYRLNEMNFCFFFSNFPRQNFSTRVRRKENGPFKKSWLPTHLRNYGWMKKKCFWLRWKTTRRWAAGGGPWTTFHELISNEFWPPDFFLFWFWFLVFTSDLLKWKFFRGRRHDFFARAGLRHHTIIIQTPLHTPGADVVEVAV